MQKPEGFRRYQGLSTYARAEPLCRAQPAHPASAGKAGFIALGFDACAGRRETIRSPAEAALRCLRGSTPLRRSSFSRLQAPNQGRADCRSLSCKYGSGSSRPRSTCTSGPERLRKRKMSAQPLEMQLPTIERRVASPFGECPLWSIKRGSCQIASRLHDQRGVCPLCAHQWSGHRDPLPLAMGPAGWRRKRRRSEIERQRTGGGANLQCDSLKRL